MPKQRNHPHHHRHGARGEHLELPFTSFSPTPKVPHTVYPEGWLPRRRTREASFTPRLPRWSRFLLAFAGVALLLLIALLLAHVAGGG